MKTWKIHFGWAIFTIVCSASWSQRTVRSREIEFLEREKVLQVRIVEAKKAAPPVAADPVPVVSATPAAPPLAIPEAPTREYQVLSDNLPTLEELRRLIQDPNEIWRAYQVIQRMVKSPIKTELLRELVGSKEASVRRAALHLLDDAMGAEAAAPLVQECLRSDPSSDVREAAAQLLGDHNAPGNLEALLQAFQKDDLNVRLACAAALSELDYRGPASQMVPLYAARLDSPDGAVRREAVEALGRLRCPERLPATLRALRDTNGDVRLEAVNALWDVEDPQVLPLVQPLLEDPVLAVRNAAKEWVEAQLGRLKGPTDK